MLGVVTLYNPEIEQVATNINLFLPFIDKLIIWDNSYKDKSVRKRMESLLQNEEEKVLWHVTGENLYIAPAIEFLWLISSVKESLKYLLNASRSFLGIAFKILSI